jgi:addiction module HigA family antidote
MSKINPIHPGEILKEEFLVPFGLSMYRLAMDVNVAPIRISQIVNGKRAITPNTALRFAKYFQTSPEFWLNLQSHYDLENAEIELRDVLKMKVKVLEVR